MYAGTRDTRARILGGAPGGTVRRALRDTCCPRQLTRGKAWTIWWNAEIAFSDQTLDQGNCAHGTNGGWSTDKTTFNSRTLSEGEIFVMTWAWDQPSNPDFHFIRLQSTDGSYVAIRSSFFFFFFRLLVPLRIAGRRQGRAPRLPRRRGGGDRSAALARVLPRDGQDHRRLQGHGRAGRAPRLRLPVGEQGVRDAVPRRRASSSSDRRRSRSPRWATRSRRRSWRSRRRSARYPATPTSSPTPRTPCASPARSATR